LHHVIGNKNIRNNIKFREQIFGLDLQKGILFNPNLFRSVATEQADSGMKICMKIYWFIYLRDEIIQGMLRGTVATMTGMVKIVV
jgi:hypothetical protein